MMSKLHPMYTELKERQERLLTRKNEKSDFYNGIYDRWVHPVLTRESVPLEWRYDLNPETNPFFQERLGSSINGTPSSIYIIYQQNTHSNDTFGYRKCIFQISFPLKCIQLFL